VTNPFDTGSIVDDSVARAASPLQSVGAADVGVPRTSRIARNTAINVVGGIVPLFIFLVTIPLYLELIGEARYGVLAIVWVVVGYFAVFDLGLSRATANQIAKMRDEPPASRERVFWTALCLNASVGAIGGIVLFFIGYVLLGHILEASTGLRAEALAALPWLAAAVPLTTVTLVLAGTLEGLERFLTVNSLAIVGLTAFQVAPLAYAHWVGPQLAGLIMSATVALSATTALSFVVTALSLPVRGRPRIDVDRLGTLLRYGGWVTVTSLVSPLLTVIDRLLIGAVAGATAVTRYTVPFALVSRVQILSTGLARTIFPRLSMLDSTDAAHVSRESLRALVSILTPLAVVGAVALEPALRAWVGADIASSSAPVGEILLMGVWLNSLAIVPFVLLQAQGRPDLPAKFHMLELAPYIGGLMLGLHIAGIQGAAWAWSGRVAMDAVLLFWAARIVSKGKAPTDWRELIEGGLLVAAACIASLTIFHVPSLRFSIGAVLVVVSFAWAWRVAPARIRLLVLRRRPS
jgi:O-antigen/teichoic acid export membrane protein